MVDKGDDMDVDAHMRLQIVTLGMKQQADELLLANHFDKALALYRELLMHLSRSQVTMLQQKELVVSCRMNVLVALSKAKHWDIVVKEAAETLVVITELNEAQKMKTWSEEQEREKNHVLARVIYFCGFALMQLGTYLSAQEDFCRSMELNPMDESVQNDYKELQIVMQMEKKIKQLLPMSIKSFQDGHYKVALETCMDALRESQLLQNMELTGLIHGNLAMIYVKMKDDGKAIEHYKRAMSITQSGGKPTPVQNERLYNILDSLAGCYLRKRDYSSALLVIEDQIELASLRSEQKDHEAMMYLNGGQVCYAMGRYPQAEEYLAIGYSAALKRLHQLDVALNCAYWLSKSYAETGALKKALKTLDAAIVTAEKKPMVAPTADMFEKLLLARVDLLDAEINVGAAESKLFKDHLREFQLWHTLSYFDGKGQIYNHVRTAEVLLHFLERKSGDADRQHSDMMQVLALVDGVNVGELSTSIASIFMKLALAKADLMFNHSSTGPTEAKELLIKLLCDLDIPGSANSSHPYELQIGALLKLMDICIHENEDELNEEVCKFLEEAINVLRANKGIDTAVSKARLVVLLPKVARWKAARGNIVGAKEILEENVQLLRGASDFNSDLLFESLVGLCVVQIRLGMLEEATQVMKEIEALTVAETCHEVSVLRDRLHTAVAAARSKNAKSLEKSFLFEKQQSVLPGLSYLCSIGPVWWSQWCGPLLACVAAVVMVFMIL